MVGGSQKSPAKTQTCSECGNPIIAPLPQVNLNTATNLAEAGLTEAYYARFIKQWTRPNRIGRFSEGSLGRHRETTSFQG